MPPVTTISEPFSLANTKIKLHAHSTSYPNGKPPLAYSDREPSFIIVLNRTKNPTPHALLAQNNLIVAPAARSAEEQLLNHATSCIQYPGIPVQYAAPPSSPQIPQFSALPSFP